MPLANFSFAKGVEVNMFTKRLVALAAPLFISLWMLFLVWPAPVMATTHVVTNTFDSGSGSLRETIASAHSGDAITFAPSISGTIVLSSGEIIVDKDIKIMGPSAAQLAISGNNSSRIFEVAPDTKVTLSDLSFSESFV
jgi:hypothetical protein